MKKGRNWSNKQQGAFLMRLGRLLEQGYTLPKAIPILKLHQNRWMQDGLHRVYDCLKRGYSLHEALARERFSSDVLGFLELSEKHGDLRFSVMEGAKMLQKKEEIKERFIKATRYPIFLFAVVLSICFIMFHLLIPHFLSLYSSLDINFPYFTIVMISIIKKVPFLFFLFAAFTVTAAAAYIAVMKKISPSKRISLLLRIPIVKRTLPVLITHQFSIQLGSLLKGGLAINEALKILEQNQYMRFFRTEAALMKQELVNGLRFEDIVAQKRYFVPELSMIIAHGQSCGMLDKELIAYSEILLAYAEEKMAKYIVVVQPVLFLFIGVMILVMFVSMLLPMFKMMDSIQ
ncbi:competence type IV pilus assembly protein ComGB [Fictibacillus sp. KU28468]|uniref:competence type IV pilus assembly protein ComGB n=1 Tax=Fictibacillus sp. KU28468 TaxID=2991053 RepID=UPI00223CB3D6|nr:competence type IV pilus assembly protein ComGB [Fictibacillus sp. KU28468]UZJ80669.1 competence type IV pilus assembly protein ComGB [Fictibacillus sp. KU28468]